MNVKRRRERKTETTFHNQFFGLSLKSPCFSTPCRPPTLTTTKPQTPGTYSLTTSSHYHHHHYYQSPPTGLTLKESQNHPHHYRHEPSSPVTTRPKINHYHHRRWAYEMLYFDTIHCMCVSVCTIDFVKRNQPYVEKPLMTIGKSRPNLNHSFHQLLNNENDLCPFSQSFNSKSNFFDTLCQSQSFVDMLFV